ncbi:PLP-dependent transferase [Parathielavia hyrcaniae]|uniref:PLP-dependent transferase n=1 Tax=Parathielavia hyrcaniae TaxID=113614 RepID=A0AAN6T5G5_9PEZI|nr:PLP-dependent transferase [Parathielavia hyrcaniae]
MPVKQINTELGHSLPPEEPHNITFHIPGWDTAKALRRGDPDLFSKLVSIYPRFRPFREVRELSTLLHTRLSLPATHGLLLYTHADVFQTTLRFSTSPRRPSEHTIPAHDLAFHVLDIPLLKPPQSAPGKSELELEAEPKPEPDSLLPLPLDNGTLPPPPVVRLYAVAYPLDRAPGAMGVWNNYGVGVSSRLAEVMIPAVEKGQGKVIWKWEGGGGGGGTSSGGEEGEQQNRVEGVPGTPGLELGEGHDGLRRRIAGLVGGGKVVGEEDVWLYPTGMAAIWRLHETMGEVRGREGKVVVLGSVFHNTFHLFEESEGGVKHFGRCDAESGVMEELEAWLEGEKLAGRRVAYVFAEFPSNPILVSVDLRRLKEVADKYSIPVVVDDTIGSFCNIDVSPVVDVLVTSITKSLSGYANVMGGAVTLPPSSPFHGPLQSALTAQFTNEYFHADAAKLLANSASYLPRSAILNRNALALATFLHNHSQSPTGSSPVTAVLYPPFTNTHANYLAMMRPTTTTTENENEPFTPGYGCLLAIEFTSLRVACAFYDHLSVFHGPHLGAHHTLAFPFNDAIWGTDPAALAYLRTYGARAEQVRVSVGLEEVGELVDTFRAALEVAEGERGREEEEGKGKA